MCLSKARNNEVFSAFHTNENGSLTLYQLEVQAKVENNGVRFNLLMWLSFSVAVLKTKMNSLTFYIHFDSLWSNVSNLDQLSHLIVHACTVKLLCGDVWRKSFKMGPISGVRTRQSIPRAVSLLSASILLVKSPDSALGNALEHNGLGHPLPELAFYCQSLHT